jgi:hypothetical protein
MRFILNAIYSKLFPVDLRQHGCDQQRQDDASVPDDGTEVIVAEPDREQEADRKK